MTVHDIIPQSIAYFVMYYTRDMLCILGIVICLFACLFFMLFRNAKDINTFSNNGVLEISKKMCKILM